MFNILKEGRVLVPNFQQRLLLGIGSFVGMLLLTGWVVINEPARMEVFTQQYKGRSIENGASIFLNACARCHGVDGKGTTGRAPALNNPMLFVKENPAKAAQTKLDKLKQDQAAVQAEIDVYLKRVEDFKAATETMKKVQAGTESEANLQKKITSLSAQIQNFDLAAAQRRYDSYIAQLNQAQTDVDKLTQVYGWDVTRDPRLTELKWSGSLAGYIESTIISGRPVSSLYWPEQMPAWGQQAGGPLRPDEIKNVTNYILNFEDMALQMSPGDVNEQFRNPSSGGPVANAAGTDVDKLVANIAGGDVAAGQAKYTAMGCAGCHNGTTAPNVDGTYTRVVNERLKAEENAGKTPEFYIVQSIVNPPAYVVPNFQPIMPTDFGQKLTADDIKNIVAFLSTKK